MLTHLTISQFTVVDSLEIEFHSGMTVLTGETGAGKSIILDALGLCLGDRADSGMIRPGADRAELTASFDVSALPAATAWLAERDLDAGGDCHLRRILSREGRSRAYINGHPATLEDCSRLGEQLIDIHGQHAHQSLLRRSYQRQLLDQYADAEAHAADVAESAHHWQQLAERLDTLRSSRGEQADREQLLRYQLQELDELQLGEHELEALEEEQRRLANADALQRDTAAAISASEAAEAHSREALRALDSALHDDAASRNIRDLLDSSAIQLNEARAELERYLASCESDPARLAELEERLDTVYSLARKHRIRPEELHAHRATLEDELAAIDSSDEHLAELEAELGAQRHRYDAAASELSALRKAAAKRLEDAVARTLKKLSMANCRFRVKLAPRERDEVHPLGREEIELQISTQPGADAQGLARIASGGELSRISLAIQVAAAGRARVPSMVFDEVDVGIGGAVAEVVGRLLADMARSAQVLCVTHLPQVAAQGRHHLRIVKRGRGSKLASDVSPLSDGERVEEIARMLGGVKMTENTLAHAREMLSLSQA
ncbi:MAG: DNA repair protein RecN [Halieaceae bacterium]|jgi:DNA repair protein RecN (Recombination protein N)|nr:DNA repair protein RecN [Halieaceae bacterium]